MKPATVACLIAFAVPPAWAQHEGHAMPPMPDTPGANGDGPARTMEPPSPALLPPPPGERAHAFPDLDGMDMGGHMDDDPFVATLAFDRLEAFDGGDGFGWEIHGWAGKRRDRMALRSRGERESGRLRDGELELLWSHASGPWWNRLLGMRHDWGDGHNREWLALGVEGIAPYKIDIAATFYAGNDGFGARAEARYDVLLTQRLVLQPRLEAAGYTGHDAPPTVFEAGLRLRYEVDRQFAPYLGYAWIRGDGPASSDGGRWVAGIHAWF